jgi:pilus assembly protein CpaB
MRARSVMTLSVGVLLAGAAVYMIDQQLAHVAAPQVVAAQPEIVLGRIVVAARELARGDHIRSEYLKEVDWPASSIMDGSFGSIGQLIGDGSDERRVRRSLVAGEPVLAAKVSGFGGRDTLGETIDPKKRAVSIAVNDVSGVSGFLLPGDRVDILLTRQLEGARSNDGLVTEVVLQNIRVLAIDQLTDEQREKPQIARTATVEVDPDEAQKLALAMQVGTLSLALRNIVATEPSQVTRIRVGDLVEERRAAPKRQTPSVVVRRGAATSVQSVNLR